MYGRWLSTLGAGKPVANILNLLSQKDFKAILKPDYLRLIQKAEGKKNANGRDKEQIAMVKNLLTTDPSQGYEYLVTDPMAKLNKYLREINFDAGAIQKISYSIANYGNEVLMPGKTFLDGEVHFTKSDGTQEGIVIQAMWLESSWYFYYTQASTFGISESVMETVTE
jgi:hypothetical protein